MAINSVLQTIRNAEIDARSLSEFVSKDASFTVTRRLAPTIHTLDYYLLVLNKVKEKGDLADIAISDTLDKLDQLEPTVIQRVEAAINNTAVEGGVLADTFVVVDGSLSQRTINKGLESVADLSTINNPKDGLRVYVKSYHAGLGKGGGYFIYNSTQSDVNDGGATIDGWVRDVGECITPEMFGAIGDGYTNDSLHIQNAITYAENNKLPLVLNNGYVVYEQFNNEYLNQAYNICLKITKPLQVKGAGTLFVQGNRHGIWVGSDDVSIEGINFSVVSDTTRGTGGHFIHIVNPNNSVALERVEQYSYRVKILNCSFTMHSDAAISGSRCHDCIISNNSFYDAPETPSGAGDAFIELHDSYGCIVSGNTFKDTDSHAIRMNGCKRCVVSNNYGENIGKEDWRAFIYLDTGSNDIGMIESQDNLVVGNKGVNVANGVRVGLGNNKGNAIVNNSLQCRNSGIYIQAQRNSITIQPPGGVANTFTFDYILKDTLIEGNLITYGKHGVYMFQSGYTEESIDTYIEGLNIVNNTFIGEDVGVYSEIQYGAEIRRSAITGNSFRISSDKNLVYIFNISNSTIKNNINLVDNKYLSIRVGAASAEGGTLDLGNAGFTYTMSVYTSNSSGFYTSHNFNFVPAMPCMIYRYHEDDELPTGISEGTQYYLSKHKGYGYKLASTREQAMLGGGVRITALNSNRFLIKFN